MTFAPWPQNYSVIPYQRRYLFSTDLVPSGGVVARCTKTIDASVAKAGESSLRINPDGTGTAILQRNLTQTTPMDLSSGRARLRLYWPYKSGNRSLTVVLSNETAGTNSHQFGYNSNILREGWNYLWLPLANRNPTDKPLGYSTNVFGTGYDYTQTTNYISVNIESSPTVDDVVYLDSIDTGSRSRCKVIIGFDAAGSELVTSALPILDGYGWTAYNAMAAVHTDATERTNLVTLKAAGWHVVNHSYNHTSYITLGASAAVADKRANEAFLDSYGLFSGQPEVLRRFIAYPENAVDDAVTQAMAADGMVAAREYRQSHLLTDDFGVDNIMRIGSVSMGSAVTLAANKGMVDFAVSQGTTLFVYGHELVASAPSSTQWTIADFTSLMAHIRRYEQQGLLDVVSWADWHLGLTQPALVVP